MAVAIKESGQDQGSGELPIAPMIDVVFLLLIYFMVSATIQKQEADIGFTLPAVVRTNETVEFPDEQVIEIDSAGKAWVNGFAYDSPESMRFEQLAAMLSRFRQASEASQSEARVTIAPSSQTAHQMVVRVLDACEVAGLRNVTFAVDEG